MNRQKNRGRMAEGADSFKVNAIVEGTRIKGEIDAPGNFRIDGEVDGNMRIEGKLIIGAKGFVKGNVVCKDAEIEGKFDGQLSVNGLLSLKSTSTITGDARFDRLMVSEGAQLSCTCNLKREMEPKKGKEVHPTMDRPIESDEPLLAKA